jgi:hypothetical protein
MPELPSNNGSKEPIGKPNSASDVLDILNSVDDTDEIPLKGSGKPEVADDADDEPEPKKSKVKDDEEIDLVEPEEETEKLDLDEEKPEELEIDAPPRKREILKKYPDVFKDFPFLEKMMYRDKAYTELFGSFDDAKEIAEKAENFDHLENVLFSGNTEEVLKSVKENDERAFNIIVDEYLPTLMKVDKDAYFHVVGNLNKRLIAEMFKEGKETDNEKMQEAAILINQFVFGSSKYTPPTNRVDRTQDPKKDEAETERLQFVQERFETSRDDLQNKVDNTLKATISEYIDPKGKMTAYVKRNAVNDAMKMLTASVARDPNVARNLDKLWRVAFENKFSRDSLGKIQSYYLGRAKVGLKNAILKARAEALKDLAPRSVDRDDEPEERTPARRTPVNTGRPSQPKDNKGPRKGESTTDYFMRD